MKKKRFTKALPGNVVQSTARYFVISVLSGASYVSALPKPAGPRSCYRIRGDFFKIDN
jgi:hypothetical protein